MARLPRYLVTSLSTLLLIACTSAPPPRANIESNEFISTDMYSRALPGTSQVVCEGARRALLSQGYVIRDMNGSQVNALKKFQPGAERHIQVEFHVVCEPNADGSNSATVFANAVRDTYALKKSSNSASIGVGAVGSLSLPFGSSDDSLVKVGSETIQTRVFYDRFFDMVEGYVDENPAATTGSTSSDQ
ncbi:MAG TPA: DUF2242 domain-containing protein [Noviherbaspirillum sp.]|uniref:DUF2242 domain-containing protein n=1 Tax=Noviherbaspirillum sp. TaxID=1926288 RepID=UPI002B48CF4C|nr:DUF2242 domain-containing protein [Noviherbaspirillum sp.]HJV85227.1 DUF2242 domain-containing protein [Noviherbaspirillum sp.]